MTTALYFVKQKYYDVEFFANMIKHLLSFMPILLIYYLISKTVEQDWIGFSLGFILTLVYSHISLLYVVKNNVYITFVKSLILKYKK